MFGGGVRVLERVDGDVLQKARGSMVRSGNRRGFVMCAMCCAVLWKETAPSAGSEV